ncbi:tetrapyrrole methylase family protein/MazG family protein [Caldicellulosiruptor bescii]|uniref:MazG family protein n=2 Tax=Caldicellulosiruptor bescii TaxID=31899 RepID=B9MPL0_CALBD|nr:nucleoside triphosphate pyrophosphohydrolase [Caldicellulosiruptor bescii]ACM59771.1 MazG family protein [Caldicellulosiruptor bescii DSM 6725]PBC87181.1 tetrapyrrole methylase family protein/MazG family protein [Caldicellulosiruptor bescii]PBC90120.1 tetrapyrrole methylase family protein/MazG family protein [Caldicellulosiruptor bescii]PBD04449.1 tetrapyrrole methylase family protein/MazG family protein [Caldicellulosiruptor bescii]PBD05917.1 tetrapyrrole methylase family protein/MazG fami
MKASFEELVEIMDILRSKCPWDKQQTHESLKKYLIEETYEVIEAIDEKDFTKLKEELGDLLLQVVFHAKIAQENGRFDIYEVIYDICQKMKRRHTHVFGSDNFSTAEEVLLNWDKVKNNEKEVETVTDSMKRIPKHLPALMRSYKVQEKAAKVGFDWKSYEGALNKAYEELEELKECLSKNEKKEKIEEEIGDILFAVVNIARFFNIDPEEALHRTVKKFITRFSYIEESAFKQGKILNEMTLEDMDKFWEEAKKV